MDNSNIMFPSTNKLGQHHVVQEILGAGTFGEVAKCFNVQTQELEAVKVVKTRRYSIKYAQQEIEILKFLQHRGPDADNIVGFNGFFFHKEKICLSFELLDCDLRKYILERHNALGGQPFLLSEVRPLIYQLATALDFLKSGGVIHADIKPDNIMVVDRYQQPPKLKLADFGGAHFSSDADPYNIIHTLWYSPAEVHIGCSYNEAVDIWAVGLVAVELFIGSPLYVGEDAYDVLKGIVATQGQPPDDVLNLGEFTCTYFNKREDSNPCWILKTPEEYEEDTEYCSGGRCNALDFLEQMWLYETGYEIGLFVDLINGMLELDFSMRFTPQQVLHHPFFAYTIPQSISPAQVCSEEEPVEPGVIQEPSCFQIRGQECFDDWLDIPIASLPAAEENLEDVQLESPGHVQLEIPSDINGETTADVQLEIPLDIQVETTADVQLEIPLDVQLEIPLDNHVETTADVQQEIPLGNHVETTADVQLEIPVDVQPNDSAQSRGCFMRLIKWFGNICHSSFHCLWSALMRFVL